MLFTTTESSTLTSWPYEILVYLLLRTVDVVVRPPGLAPERLATSWFLRVGSS